MRRKEPDLLEKPKTSRQDAKTTLKGKEILGPRWAYRRSLEGKGGT